MIKATKRKTKTVRRPKFADERYMGPEPDDNVVVEAGDKTELARAYTWYNYFYEADQSKIWLLQYLEQANYPKETIRLVKSAPGWRTTTTSGTISRLLAKGWVLPPCTMKFLADSIAENAMGGVPERKVLAKPINLQDRVQQRARHLTNGVLDQHIDQFSVDNSYVFSLYKMLTDEKASPAAAQMIKNKVTSLLGEQEAKEGFEDLTRVEQAAWIKFYKQLLLDCDRFLVNKKTVRARKPRAVKQQPTEKLVAKLKFLQTDPALQLVSIPPQQIIKAQTLWVYNTKYRQLAVYVAADENGLGVKGTTITNYNEQLSVFKRLRKPGETLQLVLTSGKLPLKRLMETIKSTPSPAKGRINDQTILLKVIK